jgi:hypothetical protein
MSIWASYPFISRMLTAVGVGTGALVGVAQAWPYVEPWLAAHRAYVRDYTEEQSAKLRTSFEPTRAALYDVQLSIARSRRAAVNDRLITLEIDAPKSENSAELIKRRQQIEQLKEERDELDNEIKHLRVQREKG